LNTKTKMMVTLKKKDNNYLDPCNQSTNHEVSSRYSQPRAKGKKKAVQDWKKTKLGESTFAFEDGKTGGKLQAPGGRREKKKPLNQAGGGPCLT